MPKDSLLSINPYIQSGDINMLYSIVCEWFSKEGTRWQLEIHSQNLDWNNDKNWILRLHKEKNNNKEYFQFTNSNIGYDLNGEKYSEDAHIKINSPLNDDNLINNVEFQTIIRQISTIQHEKHNKIISKLRANLGIVDTN